MARDGHDRFWNAGSAVDTRCPDLARDRPCRGSREKRRQRYCDAEARFQPSDNTRAAQRVAPELKEIVFYADALEVENLGEDADNFRFLRVAWRN